MNKPINVGVIGCGYWGPLLVRNFDLLPNARLKTVCDPDERRLTHLRRLYSHVQFSRESDALLKDPELDAIVIATPVKAHYQLAKGALENGKHVLVEKPMASSSAECIELIALAEKQGLALMVDHTFIYSAAVRKITEIVEAGDIGDIRYINCRRLNLGLFQKDINAAWDLAPHDISIILHVLDEFPVSINCSGANVTSQVEDVTNISLSFRHKRFATIQSSWLEPRKVREMTIVGTRRMIVYDDLQIHEKIRVYDVRVERPPHYDTFAEFQYSYHYGDSYIPRLDQEEPLKGVCSHFLECIEHGSRPMTSGWEGLELIKILEGASASLKAGGGPIALSDRTFASNGTTSSNEHSKPASRMLPTKIST